MFIGEYQHTIDEKNRLAIPAKFRQSLAKGAIITLGLDGCLFLFTRTDWEQFAVKLTTLPIAFSRRMLAGAMDIAPDKQGRVVLPDYLKKYGNLKKNVVVTGLFNRLEIWDKDLWEKYKLETEKQSQEIARKLSELGV